VPGLGLAPDQSTGWPSVGTRFGLTDSSVDKKRLARERKKQRDTRRRAKAKRRQQKQDRRHSQRPR
jgi:hypothetical protein